MAKFGLPRRKACRLLTARNTVLAVPAVWIVIILWTMYNAQSVNQRQSHKRLTYTNDGDMGGLYLGDFVTRGKQNQIDAPKSREDEWTKNGQSKKGGFQPLNKKGGGVAEPAALLGEENVGLGSHDKDKLPDHEADDEQLQAQQADVGHQALDLDNYGPDSPRESEIDTQLHMDVEGGRGPDDPSTDIAHDSVDTKKDVAVGFPVPKAIQDFVLKKNRSSGMVYAQPEPPEWDAPLDTDHFEVVWHATKAKPDSKIIVPGYRFDPPKLGEYGQPVKIDPESLSPAERAKYDEGWNNHKYNEYASLKISSQRETPDYRPNRCKYEPDLANLPKASIIICFHNEAWSVLIRTIHSILGKSPPELVEEIILVDDFSDMITMHDSLDYYDAQLDKLRLLRMSRRAGLVRARLAGTKEAKGPVLIFLDSHVECEEGWLPPLLRTIVEHPNYAVTPDIDVIDNKDFSIHASIDNIGVLEFKSFTFDWTHIMPRIRETRKSEADPVMSPTMAGGLFAIRKDYFVSLGTYDPELELWGGENIELSLKLWMCGGGIMINPCSRVAHIFRDSSPYLTGVAATVLIKNSARVVEVWADEYRRFFFRGVPYNEKRYGSVQERKELRKKLNCKSFGWYLENIYPEMYIERTGRYRGRIQSMSGLCIHRAKTEMDSPLVLILCSKASRWESTRIKEIRSLTLCMDISSEGDYLVSRKCDLQSKSQAFQYTQNKTIYHPLSNRCLTAAEKWEPLTFQPCKGGDLQTWAWPENPDYVPLSPSHR